jgi:magnesium chelatase subunit D
VRLPERELLRITGACARLGVDGVRGDIVCARAARALAALDGAGEVAEEHVRRAAALALHHRRRRDPLDGRAPDEQELERALDGAPPDDEPPPPRGNGGRPAPAPAAGNGDRSETPAGAPARGGESSAGAKPGEQPADANGPDGPAGERREDQGAAAPGPGRPAAERRDPPAPALLPRGALALHGGGIGPAGRRARTRGPEAGAIDSRPAARASADLALVASLRARLLGADAGELREHVRSGREGALVCLVVDASGSMGARRRLARVKGALIALLADAYARRDRVAVVAFRDSAAELLLAPGAPIERAAAAIRALPTGGRTPLAAGLDAATRLIRREALREPDRRAIAIVLTDGRVADHDGAVARAAAGLGRAAAAVHVVDTEDGPVRLGLATAVAAAAGGELHRLIETTRRAA